ncbi:MAG: MOSC N-terminal beta barrel domain-containing protein [Bacteroidota bacterium]
MKITELNIYPVKSLGGIALQKAELTAKGLRFDRNWMLLDENGVFMTQRRHAEMALIRTRIEDGNLIFTHQPSEQTASIPILEKYGLTLRTKVWSTTCEVQKVHTIGDWFSKILGLQCHLVFFPKKNIRVKEGENGLEQRVASLADKSPVLITNEASLVELNGRLENTIPMNRFRANIVYTGQEAYEEDQWQTIKINDVTFKTVEICGRCAVININHITAQQTQEPLRTLATYRQMDREIKFGMRMSCEVEGDDYPVIRLGDEIEVV